nr:hypothetical protein [Polymorphobacter sp.]
MIVKQARRVIAALAVVALAGPAASAPPVAGVAGGFRTNASATQRLAAALAQVHMSTCAPVFQQAGAFIFETGEANFTVQPLGPDANRWPTVVTIESNHAATATSKTPQTRLTTLVIAPAGTCSGIYTQVIYWPEACAALKARVFAGFGAEKPLLAHVMQSEANPGLQLYLTAAGPGCVSVKKELIG